MQVQKMLVAGKGAACTLGVGFARSHAEMEEAQRLRYQIFAEEMGARLDGTRRVDADRFDEFCRHLIVRDLDSGEVVGTYRILAPDAARAAGGYYSEQEFDLGRLAPLRESLVEVGRSCIHADYRSGGVIMLLWSGVFRFMREHRHEHLMGCASISMADGGHAAASIWARIGQRHLAPGEYRVFPRLRLPVESLDAGVGAVLPPLVKGYLNLGAWICGEPAWDPDFNTADLPALLSLARMTPRYARHFLGVAPT